MRRTRFDDWPCPIARTTDLLGDWWTPLVVRDVVAGVRRFDELQASLGIPRAVLAARLQRLTDEGVLERVPYEQHPRRVEYHLTPKGAALGDVLAAMWRWGSDWMWPEGTEPPGILVDRDGGGEVRPLVVDEATGRPVGALRTTVRRNPRAPARPAKGA